jgi:hypothetical protein
MNSAYINAGCSSCVAPPPSDARNATDHIAVERADTTLLLRGLGPQPELLGRCHGEHIHIAAVRQAVPRGGATARNDDQLLGRQVEFFHRPPHEGRPIQQLEADFSRPRADDDWLRAAPHPIETIDDALFGELQLGFDAAPPREPAQRCLMPSHCDAQVGKAPLRFDALVAPGVDQLPYFRSGGGDLRYECLDETLLVARLFGQTVDVGTLRLGIRSKQRLEGSAKPTQHAVDQ